MSTDASPIDRPDAARPDAPPPDAPPRDGRAPTASAANPDTPPSEPDASAVEAPTSAALAALAADAAELASWQAYAADAAKTLLAGFRAELDAEVLGPLGEAATALADRHRARLDALPAEGTALPDRDALWAALTSYRAAVAAEVLEPLRALLAERPPAEALAAVLDAPFATLGALAAEAPARLIRREPDDLLTPVPAESTGIRFRKAAERARRQVSTRRHAAANRVRRLVRREARPDPVATQSIPLRALLDHHAQVRLGRLVEALHERVQQHVAQALARAVTAADAWAHALLRAESALDHPSVHRLDALVWPSTGAAPPDDTQDADAQQADAQEAGGAPSPDDAALATALSDDATGLVHGFAAAARELQAALDAAAQPVPPDVFEEARAAFDAAQAVFVDDADRTSGLRLRPTRTVPKAGALPAARARARAGAWQRWYVPVVGRLDLLRQLLGLRALVLAEFDALLDRVGRGGVLPVLSAVQSVVDELLALRNAAAAACQRAASTDDVEGLTTALRGLLQQAVRQTEGQLLRRLQTSSLSTALERGLATTEERVAAALAALPEHLTVATALDRRPIDPAAPPERAPVAPFAHAVLDASYFERLGEGGEALRQPLFRVIAHAEEVQTAVHYTLEAALDELGGSLVDDDQPEAVAAAEAPDAEEAEEVALPPEATAAVTPAERIASAQELTVAGLARAAERLAGIAEPLRAPWAAFAAHLTQVTERRWGLLHQRIEAAGVEGQFMDVRLRVVDESARVNRAFRSRLRAGGARARQFGRWLRRRAGLLIREGQKAAGLAQSTATKQATLDAIAAAAALRAKLPLVYRRLFSTEPVGDPLLLQGRDAQLAEVGALVQRWQQAHRSNAVVVTAPPGGGATSFVRVAAGTLLDGLPVHRLDLSERLGDPDALAEALARALGLDVEADAPASQGGASPERNASPEGNGPLPPLKRLERRILTAPASAARPVCVIEHLEHLMLRTGGGLAPLEAVLAFMSRTDHRVFWLATCTEPAWRFVARTAPTVTGLADTVALPPLDRDTLEAVILKRHMRSGLPLVFQEPQVPTPLLTRRLRAAKTDAERQDLLRADYFDRLGRAAGRNVALALFYWLRSLDFEAAADRLTVRSLPALDFAFLLDYDLPRAFALKAFLQHGTLTLGEYQRVFRATPRESYLVFEALANEGLLVRAEAARDDRAGVVLPVRAGERYRLHPLFVHPVTDALRSRNML